MILFIDARGLRKRFPKAPKVDFLRIKKFVEQDYKLKHTIVCFERAKKKSQRQVHSFNKFYEDGFSDVLIYRDFYEEFIFALGKEKRACIFTRDWKLAKLPTFYDPPGFTYSDQIKPTPFIKRISEAELRKI